MEKRDNLELVNVAFENNGQKAVLTFLDKERAEVRTVNFNRQVYRDNKYVADDAKAEKVDTWCHDIFGCEFTELPSCVGKKYTVYEYDDFNSLFEVQIITKFTKDQVGQIFQTAIDEVVLDDYFIKIHYTIDGKTYESKQTFGTYLQDMKQWFVDPLKKEKEFAKFENKYHVKVEDRDKLVGHPIMVEVKPAFGDHYWGDIKKFPARRK